MRMSVFLHLLLRSSKFLASRRDRDNDRLDRIENSKREQFHAIVNEKPQQSIAPNEPSPTPPEWSHEQPIDSDQCRHDLRAQNDKLPLTVSVGPHHTQGAKTARRKVVHCFLDGGFGLTVISQQLQDHLRRAIRHLELFSVLALDVASVRLCTGSFPLRPCRQSIAYNRLGFSDDELQMIRSLETLGIDLVNVLGARRTRGKPSALSYNL